jgi:hypothetical protein
MRRSIAIVIAFCLAFSGLFFSAPALAVDGEAKDVFAARVIAKSTQNRVLVTGLLDEFSTTYVNPDGSLTTDSYGSAIRVRDDSLGYTGQKRTDYMFETAAIWAVSWRLGGVSTKLLSNGLKSNTSTLRSFASKPKWFRGLGRFVADKAPGAAIKLGIKAAQNYAYSSMDQ